MEKNSTIRGSVLAGNVRVGAGSTAYEGAVVGDGSIIEGKATIRPGVRIWPYKRIESGALVDSNLIWGNQFRRSLFGSDGVRGELDGDLTLENALKMGSAFAFMLGGSVPVVIGGDAWGPSQLLKKAIAVGLLAGGAKVIDIGETIAPVVRQAVTTYQSEGGIYLHSCSSNYGYSAIRFFDNEGLNLPHFRSAAWNNCF